MRGDSGIHTTSGTIARTLNGTYIYIIRVIFLYENAIESPIAAKIYIYI